MNPFNFSSLVYAEQEPPCTDGLHKWVYMEKDETHRYCLCANDCGAVRQEQRGENARVKYGILKRMDSENGT